MTRWTSLRRLTRFAYGDSLVSASRHDGPVPVFGSNGQVGTHVIANTRGPVVVIGRKGSFGAVAFSGQPAFVIDTAYFIDDRHTENDLRWLFYVLQFAGMDSVSQDTGVPGLSREAAYRTPVPWVPLDHQRSIADFLDRETARIDELIQAKEHLRDLLAERIWAAFLAELNSAATREVQIRRTLTSITDGPFGSAFRSSDYITEGAFVVRLGNIGFAEFREEPSAFIPVELFNSLIRYRVIEGDVIIAGLGDERNHAGRAAVAPSLGNALVKGKCFRARVNQDRVLPEFLAWFLSSPLGAKRVSRMSRGSTRSMINLEIIKAVPLPLPEIAQQRRIVEKMSQIRKTARLAESAIVSQLGLLQERRQALITAAVTGQLDIAGDGAYEELEKATA